MNREVEIAAIEYEIAKLLTHHRRDGQICVSSSKDMRIAHLAYQLGLVNEEGILTDRGRQVSLTIH